MASWTNNGGGIQSKHQLGFDNFKNNSFKFSNMPNSTGGFASNSDVFPKGNNFTAQKTVNSGFGTNSALLPKENGFATPQTFNSGFASKPATPFSFGSNPFGQSPFGTNPTPAATTPVSSGNSPSGDFSFGTNSTLLPKKNAFTTLDSSGNSQSRGFSFPKVSGFNTPGSSGNSQSGGFSFPKVNVFTTPVSSGNSPSLGGFSIPKVNGFTTPAPSGNSQSRGFSFPKVNGFTTPVSSGNSVSGGFSIPKVNGGFTTTVSSGNLQSGGFSFEPFSTLVPKEKGFNTQNTPFVSNPIGQSPFGKVSTPPLPVTCMETSTTDDQGSSVKPYAKTKTAEKDGKLLNLLSISAMPFYNTKSHEELRLEDYQLSGKTGSREITVSISAVPVNKDKSHEELRVENYMLLTGKEEDSKSSFTFQRLNTPTSEFPRFTTTSLPKFNIFNRNLQPSISNTCTSDERTPFVPSQPVIPTAPSIGTVTQMTTSVPNPGNAFPNIKPLTTEPVVTSIPQPLSTGGFITRSDNRQQQQPTSPCAVSVGQSLVTNPFATEVRHTPLTPTTLQYGISCLPVSDFAAKPAKGMPLVNARPLSLGRRRSPIVKYKPNTEEKKVPFYDEFPGIYKNNAALIPRENPGAWLVLPNKQKRLEKSMSNLSVSDHSTDICETGGTQSKSLQVKKADDADVIAMIPKFTSPEYFMKPSTDELTANELKTPGFCCQVKDFVIGRHKYGSIKFSGETDVRNLNLESIVQFNNREVIVYMDEKAKPPVGQGLNKAAEITLLNIRCIDKNTGNHYTDGAKVDKYKQCLVKKTMEQGAEFLSFDPVKGEWRFKVEHF